MPNHWLLRVGNGNHFTTSSKYHTWGITSKPAFAKGFIRTVQEGDLLWFVKGGSKGLIMAVATFTCLKERQTGPLIALTLTNEELGWTESDGDWDTEVHYKDLYNLMGCDLYSEIKSPSGIRLYNEKCKVNLPSEYPNIVRYSKVTSSL